MRSTYGMVISTMALWDLWMSMFWMDAEIEMTVKIKQTVCWSWSLFLCRVRWENGLLPSCPLQQVKMAPMEENEYSWAETSVLYHH